MGSSRGRCSRRPRPSPSPAASRARPRSSTASPTSRPRRSTASRSTRRRRNAAGCRCPTCAPRTSWWSRRRSPTPPAPTGSSGPSTPATSSSTSGPASSATSPGWRWANFDQPDLKAVHGFIVSAPETWTVLSNSASTSVEDLADGGRLWTFADTPPLSTYVMVVNAGPFYELRSRRGGHDLGLYCRQSLKDLLDRDAEELFELTEQGLAWFGEHFGIPFGQERYDHVFVPDLGGAMENWGCVTCGDWALPRSTPTYDERREIAEVVLHEMAHMWFGDLVTMRWWDDLWLNEAFASWAACWAAEGATRYSDGWASFLAVAKQNGYRLDMGPATHPIRGDVPDVAQAMANFDAHLLLQGPGRAQAARCVRRRRRLPRRPARLLPRPRLGQHHPRGPHRCDRLGERTGPRRVGDGLARPRRHRHARALRRHPDGRRPRRRARRGRTGSTSAATPTRATAFEHVADVPVLTSGSATEVELPDCDLRLVNDHDLTFAAARTDQQSLDLLLRRAGQLPDVVSRALAVTTAYDMLVKGELSADDTLTCVLGVLETERLAGVVEPFLQLAGRVAAQVHAGRPDRCAAEQGRRRGRRTREGAGARPGCPARAGQQRRHRRALRPGRRGRRRRPRSGVAGRDHPRCAGRVRRGRGGAAARARPRPRRAVQRPDRAHGPAAPGGQGGGVARLLRRPVRAVRAEHVLDGDGVLAARAARGAAAVHLALPRGGPQARRRSDAQGGQPDPRHVPRRGRPGVPRRGVGHGACRRHRPDGPERPARRQRHPGADGCAPAASSTELPVAQVRKPHASRTQAAPSYITPVPRTAGPDTRRHR